MGNANSLVNYLNYFRCVYGYQDATCLWLYIYIYIASGVLPASWDGVGVFYSPNYKKKTQQKIRKQLNRNLQPV